MSAIALALSPTFEGKPLRVLSIAGRPAWVAKEVGMALGYEGDGRGFSNMIRSEWSEDLQEGIDFVLFRSMDSMPLNNIDGLNNPRGHLVLFESGIYLASILSKKPAGRRLRRWLADEVLPQIRRTGSFETSSAAPAIESPVQEARLVEPTRMEVLSGRLSRASEILELGQHLVKMGAITSVEAVCVDVACLMAPEALERVPGPAAPSQPAVESPLALKIPLVVWHHGLFNKHWDKPPCSASEWLKRMRQEGQAVPWNDDDKITPLTRRMRMGMVLSAVCGLPIEASGQRWALVSRKRVGGSNEYHFERLDS